MRRRSISVPIAVVDWRHVPGVRPRILFDDIMLVGEVARADPRFRAALAKRGITNIERVQVDPWSAGNYGLPDEEGRRLSHTFCWYRSEQNDNGYAHPIEGLCAVIDLDRAEVLRIDDYGVAAGADGEPELRRALPPAPSVPT